MAGPLPSDIESFAVQLSVNPYSFSMNPYSFSVNPYAESYKLTDWFADLGISLWTQHGRPWSLNNLPEKC